ncbi:MAG: hypothetical protein KGP28_08685 [Bdellovibrionales bacterium]|nr:hypothetical protein [Bdellovibrionales bacterium]
MGPKFRHSGIRSKTLVGLVRNTAPFVFEDDAFDRYPYGRILRGAEKLPPDESDLHSYFDLCLASHFASVGTFVPTDVDLAIREKLWSGVHDENAFAPLWNRVQEFLTWDDSPVSRRWVGAGEEKLSGHQGEWLTVAMGAYATALRIGSGFLPEIREAIESEVKREERALSKFRERFLENPSPETMKAYLSGVAAVAHNLGDLDRMFDAFSIEDTDVLKRRVYRGAHEDSKNKRPVFQEAGSFYQEFLANENHRNFALREPKGLRRSSRFLLPFGLFLDDWGVGLVEVGLNAGVLNEGDLREIIESLVSGWKKLNPKSIYTSQGYSRALVGVAHALGGREMLLNLVPPQVRRDLEESGLRTLMNTKKDVFEKKLQLKLHASMNLNP